MMTLDEAIEHASQVADSYKDTTPCCKCANEHRQLAEWLTELKVLRDENDRLRSELESVGTAAYPYWRSDLRDENAKLRELLVIVSDVARDYDGDRRLLRRLVQELYEDQCDECDQWKYRDRLRALGVEVP